MTVDLKYWYLRIQALVFEQLPTLIKNKNS
jgi:hypothetical protein